MESAEISEHLVRVYEYVKEGKQWVTTAGIADCAGVAPRTARAHALKLVQAGIFDQMELYPGHRYNLSPKADKRNKGFLQRLEQALRIINITRKTP